MSKNNPNPDEQLSDDQLDAELHALIADATTGAVTTIVASDTASNDTVIDMELIEAAATAAEIKSTAYEEQEAEQEGGTGTVTPIGAARTTRAPRASRAAGAKASSVLGGFMDDETMLKAAMLVTGDQEDPALVDALKTDIDGLAKKVGDKAVNLLRYQSNPGKLQGYTRLGLQHLIEHGGASSKTLTDMLQAKGYTIGTARSQANQLMALLPTMKIADKLGRKLTLRADSVIVANFNIGMTPAAATA